MPSKARTLSYKFLPYRTLLFVVDSSPDAVASALKTQTAERSLFSFKSSPEMFRGRVTSSAFEVVRQIHYRNSFLPVIIGSIRATPTGSAISVVMRLHAFVIAFMATWLSGVGFFGFEIATLADSHDAGPLCVVSGMFVFGALLPTLAFKFEADKAERLLTDLFSKL